VLTVPADPPTALLVLSFGGPDRPADVLPFLRRVTAGRGVPDERLTEVAEHYHRFGGRSPINEQNRALLDAVRAEFGRRGQAVPVYWGNRNWHPLLADTVRRIAADGHRRVAVFVTSAYASYSGCRQYRENLADAVAETGLSETLSLVRLPHYHARPGFVAPFADGLRDALARLPTGASTVFVTHSIPTAMDAAAGPHGHAYTAQHRQTAQLVAAAAGLAPAAGGPPADRGQRNGEPWLMAYCSRSGPPSMPWLEPDVNDVLRRLAGAGCPGVAVVPIGFVSDHMEVRYDLDTEAAGTAADLGLAYARVSTPGIDPRFVATIADMFDECAADPAAHRCPAGCCANPRGPRPALCGCD